MDKPTCKAALFDFDGTLMDTEPQYSIFWGRQGEKFHPEIPNFERVIKGQTLGQIFDGYFANMPEVQQQITEELNEFEQTMKFSYISGAKEYVLRLREKGIKTAIVTSSNDKKMAHAYRACPELKEMFDLILTADMFTHSKPDPDCFLTAAEKLGHTPNECVVYEVYIYILQGAE